MCSNNSVLNRHFDIRVYNDHENEKKTDGLQSNHKKHSHPNYNFFLSKTNVQDPIKIPTFLLTFLIKNR